MKRTAKWLGLVIGVAALAAFIVYARKFLTGQELAAFASRGGAAGIAIAALCYCTIIPITALAWRGLLGGMGERRAVRELAAILGITQLAKYLPGNVGVHVGRAAMAVGRGMNAGTVVSSMLLETFLAVVAAVLVGLAGALLSARGLGVLDSMSPHVLPMMLVLVAGAVGVALLGPRMAVRLRAAGLRRGWAVPQRLLPHWKPLGLALAAYAANYLIIGLGLLAMAHCLLPEQRHDGALLTASFALAWMAGFLAPGAPAGLGVREGLMLLVLALHYPAEQALLLVIGARLATMVGDLLCFGGGYALLPSARTAPKEQ